MNKLRLLLAICLSFSSIIASSQNVPILSHSVNAAGQVELEIEGSADKYYLLSALHEPNFVLESITSMTIGVDGNMIISEPCAAYPLQSYKVTAHSIADPDDSDGDGVDDITEFYNMPDQSPFNFADPIPIIDGATSIDSRETYSELGVINDNIPWAPFLNNQEFVKFAILNQETDEPRIYFINSKTHYIHADFLATVNTSGASLSSGEIVYNPNVILPNGVIGSYSFNYSFGNSYSFEFTQRTFELLVANMPFLQNNMQHFIGDVGESDYLNNFKDDYEGSRINVILESEFFEDVDFLPFNIAEGYGFFREMDLDENPSSRDIVLYDALPNSLPRVGGIITSVIQTPLSHVNLRAIQDNVPNAYIKDPLLNEEIADLIGKYIYYKVGQDSYEIREATLEEVNLWYENIRPTDAQIPDRDLSKTKILPLDDIEFEMSTAFGAKCSNVATMRRFGFPEGTIPNGFGVPFYFYDEFMKFNGFYEDVETMISDPGFISDLETRIDMLKDFRKEIKDADMPQWMLDELEEMHDSFPEGTSVRCRSSTNNEDLPGFSGAGLYTSKTQHPEEGHISKSIKQVYASMWNFRAFDERDFYRVDHYIAAMGVLCHPNFEDEKSNGVGVSLDPIYLTDNTFYLNTQVGESLITNPDANSIPEEILLNEDPEEGYFVLRYSNLVPQDELVMDEGYLDLMRDYLKIIHDEFEILYNLVGAEGFGMDIEYKVTVDDRLIIKQARPWVSFWADIKANFDIGVIDIKEPVNSSALTDAELVTVTVENQGLRDMKDFEISLLAEGELMETIFISDELTPSGSADYQFTVPLDLSEKREYNLAVVVAHPSDGYSKNDTLETIIQNLFELEAGISAELKDVRCGENIDVIARVTNYGAATFTNTLIEVVVNGLVVDVVDYGFSIPYLTEVDININVTENLMEFDNVIQLNLLSVNGEEDAIDSNNSSEFNVSLDADFDDVTLIINADDYPMETSWALYNEGILVDQGSLSSGTTVYEYDICVNYEACYDLYVYDAFGDGICCLYGQGDFSLLTSDGTIMFTNNGNFGSETSESFCPADFGCSLEMDITTVITSNIDASDGSITITPIDEEGSFLYSIDGGFTFNTSNIFENLPAGIYEIVVNEIGTDCSYLETVEVESDITDNVTEIASEDIKLYPNPTSGKFILEISDQFTSSSVIMIEIYNNLGQIIQQKVVPRSTAASKVEISIEDQPQGTYIAKCFNEDYKKYFKVIKLQ